MIKDFFAKFMYWLFIGILFFVGLFTGSYKVNAVTTITPSSWGSKVHYTKANLTLNTYETVDSSWLTGDYTNFCSNSGGYTYNCYLLNNWYYVKLSTSLDAGKTYTMNFSTYNTNRGTQTYYNKSTFTMIASNTGEYNGSSSSNISAFSCRAGIAEGTQSRVDWSCTLTPATAINYIYMNIKFDTGNPLFTSYSVSRASLSYDNSQTDAINQQTNIIQNEFNEITNQINENNQQIINGLEGLEESMTNNQMVCNKIVIDKNSIIEEGKILNSSGNISSYTGYGVTDYIEIRDINNRYIKVTQIREERYCFYDENKSFISCGLASSLGNITIPNNAIYFRATISLSQNKPQFEINSCKNGNQALNDSITDDNVDDPSNMLSDMEDMLPSNGTITNLIGLPITLYTKVLNSINGTCTQFNLGSLYGTNLIIPCIDIDDYLGSTIWNTIDIIISGAFVLIIAKKMVKAFENFTSMKEGDVIND